MILRTVLAQFTHSTPTVHQKFTHNACTVLEQSSRKVHTQFTHSTHICNHPVLSLLDDMTKLVRCNHCLRIKIKLWIKKCGHVTTAGWLGSASNVVAGSGLTDLVP